MRTQGPATSFRLLTIFLLLFGCSLHCHAQQLSWLRARGTEVVNEKGKIILLRGVGLGNWLLPEGYMWRFGENGDRPRKIEKLISDLIGPEKAAAFWYEFRRQYITEQDVQRINVLGFNCLRAPLNARLFLSEGDKPEYQNEGFELLDNLVSWCRKNGVYVIIDMHAAPGGQTGQNIDDSIDDQPQLFMDPKYSDRLENLWVKIVQRYKDDPTVAAFDLLNEPLPKRTGAEDKYKAQLVPLYKKITAAIRDIDKRHMITVEGADWANDWSVFGEPFDKNLLYQFHYYAWDRPDNLKGIGHYLDERKRLNAPIWIGETGEKDNVIYWGSLELFESHGVGWAFWPWKKMETSNTPYSIRPPSNWQEIVEYSRGRAKPSSDVAQKAFDELLKNIRLENCDYFPDVVNAIFRRVPARVEAENFGQDGVSKSWSVKLAAKKSQYYRKTEPVPIEPITNDRNARRAEQAIHLNNGEWTAYNVNCRENRDFAFTIRVKSPSPAVVHIAVAGNDQSLNINGNDWQTLSLKPVKLQTGKNRLQFTVVSGSIDFDWFELR